MRGLYAVTGDHVSTDKLITDVELALRGGVTAVQYRDKQSPQTVCEQRALAMRALCREYGVPLVINDDVELTKKINADGVHLGRGDTALTDARRRLGKGKMIGVSCYNDFERALQVAELGADYIALGRFFASANKPDTAEISLDVLKQVRQRVSLPIVAIGGITAQNGAPLVAIGADMLAVIDGVFAQADITRAAMELVALFATD